MAEVHTPWNKNRQTTGCIMRLQQAFYTLATLCAGCFAAPACGDPATQSATSAYDVAAGALSGGLSSNDIRRITAASGDEISAIEISKLALHRSREPLIRQYAEAMGVEHGVLYQQLTHLSQPRAGALPGVMSRFGQEVWTKLFPLGAAHFDDPFLSHQTELQKAVIETYKRLGASADSAALRSWAAGAQLTWERDAAWIQRLQEAPPQTF